MDGDVAQLAVAVCGAPPNFSGARNFPPVKIRIEAFSRPPFVSPVAVTVTPLRSLNYQISNYFLGYFQGERFNGMIGMPLNARKCCIIRVV